MQMLPLTPLTPLTPPLMQLTPLTLPMPSEIWAAATVTCGSLLEVAWCALLAGLPPGSIYEHPPLPSTGQGSQALGSSAHLAASCVWPLVRAWQEADRLPTLHPSSKPMMRVRQMAASC